MMKIEVDRDLCEGNALCVKAAPGVFRVDDSDTVEVLVAEVGPEVMPAIKEAVRRCPRGALALVEAGE